VFCFGQNSSALNFQGLENFSETFSFFPIFSNLSISSLEDIEMADDCQFHDNDESENNILKRELSSLKSTVEVLNSRCFDLESRLTREISISGELREQLETGRTSSPVGFCFAIVVHVKITPFLSDQQVQTPI
jgi:hypothetical protein